ncbi:HTTM domain-containing protein [Microbacterium deminutum]|uniref:HTTM-like domain-containing protein n=1 Tax=Microbacterium deminutum TaxID=344164 RepID=A0ABN2R9G0_9MICO
MSRFDSWVNTGPFSARDVGLFRIVFTLLLIPYLPRLSGLGAYPSGLLDPPAGPFAMLREFPPVPVLVVMELVIAVAVVATLCGLYTRVASILLTVMLVIAYGLVFSLGKVDHVAVMISVPAIMSFARWGDTFSLDALRRRPRRGRGSATGDPTTIHPTRSQPQWPLRFLAIAIGIAFVTAAIPKVSNGWLDFSTQASYGYQVRQNFIAESPGLLAGVLAHFPSAPLWEMLDWVTVLLELGVLVSVLSWTTWRTVLSLLTLFHLAIALSLGIFFVGNVLAYGAFVSWGRVRLPAWHLSVRTSEALARFGPAGVLIVGAIVWIAGDALWSVRLDVGVIILVAGAGTGAGYLIRLARALLRRFVTARSERAAPVA